MLRRAIISSILVAIAAILVTPMLSAYSEGTNPGGLKCDADSFYCPLSAADELAHELQGMATPKLTGPPPPAPPAPSGKIVTFDTMTRGNITADFTTFKMQALQTLNDGRGWSRLGVQFQEVASGGNFTLVLSEASQVPSFSSICSAEYSCSVGRYVIINQDRWLGATKPWNDAGGNIRDYRHMVVNHEAGHWLGHGHRNCAGPGQPAPVMQQQSINLQGCAFNPWPLDNELSSSRLGI